VIDGPTYTQFIVPRADAIVPVAEVVDDLRRFAAGDGYEVSMRAETLVVGADGDELVTARFDVSSSRYVIEAARELEVLEIAMHLGTLLVMKTHGTQLDPDVGVITSSTRKPSKLRLLDWIPKLEARARAFAETGERDDRERTALWRALEDYNVVTFGDHRATFVEHDAPTLAQLHEAAQQMFAYYDSPERAVVFREAPPHRIGGGLALDLARSDLAKPGTMTRHAWLAALERHVRDHAPAAGCHEATVAGHRVKLFVRDEDAEPRLWDVQAEGVT